MTEADYRQLIREMCEAAEFEDWEQLAYARHFEIDGVVAALLHDEEAAPDTLTICFQFGDEFDPARHGHLLAYNMTAPASPDGRGAFGVMPDQDRVAYRTDLSWQSPMAGSDLFQLLTRHLRSAQAALQESFGA